MDFNYSEKFNCSICKTRCDGRSKAAYNFEDDIAISRADELFVIEKIQRETGLRVIDTEATEHGLPDLEVWKEDKLICRVEVKHQGRAFMSIRRLLPQSKLMPYETIALNLSDLLRYFEQNKQDKLPSFIVWHVIRPCIGDIYIGNDLRILNKSYETFKNKRTFRRSSTNSDYVNGQHKGVTVNYHFSIKEMIPFDEIISIIGSLSK